MKSEIQNSAPVKAILLIGFGFILLFNNLNMLGDFQQFIDWRLVFIVFTVIATLKGEIGGAIFWTLLACFFYFPEIEIKNLFKFWPLILVGIGLKKIINSTRD
jgi:hypothetical protein